MVKASIRIHRDAICTVIRKLEVPFASKTWTLIHDKINFALKLNSNRDRHVLT